jgi:hypothetical protein
MPRHAKGRVGSVIVSPLLWALERNPSALDVALDARPAAVMLSFGDAFHPTDPRCRLRHYSAFRPAQIASMLQETGFAMDLTRVVGPIILACAILYRPRFLGHLIEPYAALATD